MEIKPHLNFAALRAGAAQVRQERNKLWETVRHRVETANIPTLSEDEAARAAAALVFDMCWLARMQMDWAEDPNVSVVIGEPIERERHLGTPSHPPLTSFPPAVRLAIQAFRAAAQEMQIDPIVEWVWNDRQEGRPATGHFQLTVRTLDTD